VIALLYAHPRQELHVNLMRVATENGVKEDIIKDLLEQPTKFRGLLYIPNLRKN